MYLPFSSTLPALLLSQFPSRLNPFSSNGEVSTLDIDRPDPPAPHGYDPLPDAHRDALAAAWSKLETQLAAPESDWTSEGEESGVKRWSRNNPESGLPLMKGEGFIQGFSALEISAVMESMAMRKIWDPRMDSGFMLARYSPSQLEFYTATKPPGWLVWPRDIVGASDTKHWDNATRIRNLATSVSDERAPGQDGKVRAELHFSGWDLVQTHDGTQVVSLTSIDLSGSLPNWVTRSALKETPLAIAKIRDALNDIGVPPRLIGSPSSVIQLTSLADDHKSWVMWLRGKKGDEFAVRWDAKMFPNGVIIGTEQEGWAGVEYKEDGQTIHIKVNDAAHEKQALLRLTAK